MANMFKKAQEETATKFAPSTTGFVLNKDAAAPLLAEFTAKYKIPIDLLSIRDLERQHLIGRSMNPKDMVEVTDLKTGEVSYKHKYSGENLENFLKDEHSGKNIQAAFKLDLGHGIEAVCPFSRIVSRRDGEIRPLLSSVVNLANKFKYLCGVSKQCDKAEDGSFDTIAVGGIKLPDAMVWDIVEIARASVGLPPTKRDASGDKTAAANA